MTRTRALKLLLSIAGTMNLPRAAVELAVLHTFDGKPDRHDASLMCIGIAELLTAIDHENQTVSKYVDRGDHAAASLLMEERAERLDTIATVIQAMAQWMRRSANAHAEMAGAR